MIGSDALSPEADAFLAEATTTFRLRQEALAKEWRADDYSGWRYDHERGRLRLEFDRGPALLANGQLMATYCRSDHSLEWAWNSPHFNAVVTRESRGLRALGARLGISYLRAGMVPVPNEMALSYLCAIGVHATASRGIFRGGDADEDVQVLILLKRLRWADLS